MLVLVAAVLAADMSGLCPTEEPALPLDLEPWFDATSDIDDIADLAYAWYDEACVVCASGPHPDHPDSGGEVSVCETSGCVTGAGARMDYHSVEAFPYSSTLTIRPPADAGLGWTELTYGSSTGDSEVRTASWVGDIGLGYPPNGSVWTAFGSYSGAWSESSWRSWSDGACAWSWMREDYAGIWSVTAGGHEVEIMLEACGPGELVTYFDGVMVGAIRDMNDWRLIGSDADGDGWPSDHGDCDDADATVHPCQEDTTLDGRDTNCDGGDVDMDRDGYADEATGGDDCDDADPHIHPHAEDEWYDGVDQDCDGANDFDQDGDGYTARGAHDCDDLDADRHPDADEIACDGRDQDCDGEDLCVEDTAAPESPPSSEAPRHEPEGGCAAASPLLLILAARTRRRRQARA